MLPFECYGDDGRIYFQANQWNEFRAELERQYPHNTLHRRTMLGIACPSHNITDIWPEAGNLNGPEKCSVIFGVYPLHYDPANYWQDSWIFFVEDGHADPTYGETVMLYKGYVSGRGTAPVVVFFRNMYWQAVQATGGHHGPVLPPPKKQSKKCPWRSIDD